MTVFTGGVEQNVLLQFVGIFYIEKFKKDVLSNSLVYYPDRIISYIICMYM